MLWAAEMLCYRFQFIEVLLKTGVQCTKWMLSTSICLFTMVMMYALPFSKIQPVEVSCGILLCSMVWPWPIKSNCTTSQTVKSNHITSILTWTGVTTMYSPSFPLSLGMFHKSLSNWLVRKWSSFWMVKFTFVSICTLFSIWTRRWRITSPWLDAQEVVQCWARSSQWIVRRHKPS